jgi:hypothetical protein
MSMQLWCIVAAFALAGCGRSPDTTEPADSDAPAGMVRFQDAGNVPEGTVLYSRTGYVFGTIRGYDASHTFRNGKVEPGVLVEHPGGTQFWLVLRLVNASAFYVKR